MSKPNLSIKDVEKLAELSKLEISLSETENYLKDINNILGHLSSVSEAQLTTSNSNLIFVNNSRADVLEPRDFEKEIIFSNIPDKSKDNYVKVAKVINKI